MKARQSFLIAGERLSINFTNFHAHVQRNQLSLGSSVALSSGQVITLTPAMLAAYAIAKDTRSSTSLDGTQATTAVQLDHRR